MTIEETIEPGTEVEAPCDICKGSGVTSYAVRGERPQCWRCLGAGNVKCVTPPRNCLSCDMNWIDGQIAKKHMSAYGATHFGKEMGIYRFDHTVAYQCPECDAYVSRFGPRQILTKDQVFNGTYKELVG